MTVVTAASKWKPNEFCVRVLVVGVLLSQGVVSFDASTLDDDVSLFSSNYTGLVTRVFLDFLDGGVACGPGHRLSNWGCEKEGSPIFTYISAYNSSYFINADGEPTEPVVCCFLS